MKRVYENIENKNNVNFFIGKEVEKTPAHLLNTLFVVGVQNQEIISNLAKKWKVEHIFFGANHSFNPQTPEDWNNWEEMIMHFLKENWICTLDIPFSAIENFNDGGLCEYNNFIPQIRIPVPYIKLWNYNTMLKIDDLSFNVSNPGVWCHRLHDLMNYDKFTSWQEYNQDKIVK